MVVLFRMFLISLTISLTSAILAKLFGFELDNANYWEKHGLLFLIFISIFPRLTLLLSSVASGGILWWLGWLFYPRILVALLATYSYWNHNPFLVLIAWIFAIGGESTEKYVVRKQVIRVSQIRRANYRKEDVIDI